MPDNSAIADAYQSLGDIAADLECIERKVQELQRTIAIFPSQSEGLFADDLGPDEHPERILDEASTFVAQLRGTLAHAHIPLNDAHSRVARLGAKPNPE